MAKKKRRKKAAQPARMADLVTTILAGVASGLITEAIVKLLRW